MVLKPLRLAALAAVLLLCFVPARAGEDSIEVVLGGVNVSADNSELDDSGYAAALSWDHVLTKGGAVSGHLNLARADKFSSDQVGAWSIDVGARVHFGDTNAADGTPPGRVRGYLEGRLGGTWQDKFTQTETVTVSSGGSGGLTTTPVTAEIEVGSADQYLTAGAAAGLRVYFDTARTIGLGVEGAYRKPLNAQLDVNGATRLAVFLIVPAEPTPTTP
jgi:hypothetical protein